MNTRAILLCTLLGLTGCGMVPAGDSQPTRRSSAPVSAPAPVAFTKEAQMCLAGVGETGSRFSPLPDRYYGAGCQAVNSLRRAMLTVPRALRF